MADELIHETPAALALIICDQLITDERTKKKTLVGIFNNLNVRELPKTHPSMVVFASVQGGNGRYDATLKLCHQNTNDQLLEISGPIEFENPLHVVEIAFNLINVQFLEAGPHCFEFYCNGELIFSRPFKVTLRNK